MGWKVQAFPMGSSAFEMIRVGDTRKSDAGDPPDGDAPHGGFASQQLHTTDTDAAAARAKKNGGATPMGPESVPGVGRIGPGRSDRRGPRDDHAASATQ